MKRIAAVLTGMLMAVAMFAFAPSALADDLSILHAPQSYQWCAADNAEYFCTVEGDPAKLFTYRWHIVYQGTDYVINDADGSAPWELVAGVFGTDADRCYFDAIDPALDGSEIYCTVADATDVVESPHAIIMVREAAGFFPPEISAPVWVETHVGQKVMIGVTTSSRSGNVSEKGDGLTYEWMRCSSPDLFSAQVYFDDNGNPITTSLFVPPVDKSGIFYYVCRVIDGAGTDMENVSYSNIIEFVVNADMSAKPPSGDPSDGGSGSGSSSGSGGGSSSGSGGSSSSGSSIGSIVSSTTTSGSNSVTVTTGGSTDPGKGDNPGTGDTVSKPDNGNENNGNNGSNGSSGVISTGLIVGIIVGVVVLAALIAVIIILAVKNKKMKEQGGAHSRGSHAKK